MRFVDADLQDPSEISLLSHWAQRYQSPLLRFFRRRMPAGEDQDLVQEVFVRLARRGDLRDVRDVERYIFRTASNVLADWRRQLRSHHAQVHGELDPRLPDDDISPDRVAIGKDLVQRLAAVVMLLPARTQAVFSLYHFEHMSHAEISRALGIAVRTVEDHMARANATLLGCDLR